MLPGLHEDSASHTGIGFGIVYKGVIDDYVRPRYKSTTVAIKELDPHGLQGDREWLAEVNYSGQLRHPNLVKLIGYCCEGDHRLLVYEYMVSGSLEKHLFLSAKGLKKKIVTPSILIIAFDAAKGLAFLHGVEKLQTFCLMGSEFNAKLSDFGLAKMGPTGDQTHVSTRVIDARRVGPAAPQPHQEASQNTRPKNRGPILDKNPHEIDEFSLPMAQPEPEKKAQHEPSHRDTRALGRFVSDTLRGLKKPEYNELPKEYELYEPSLEASKIERSMSDVHFNGHIGRQFWEFDQTSWTVEERALVEKARNEFRQNRHETKHSSDLLMRIQVFAAKENSCGVELPLQVKVGTEEEITSDEKVGITLTRALRFYSTLQAEDGHWPGDYGGPLFLLPGLVIALSVMDAVDAILPDEHKKEMCRYLYNHQNLDGGWGLHIEGHSTMFCTALNYVALRLLGEKIDGGDRSMQRARKWILDHGGATCIPSWGKCWLSVLGAYEWNGNNPLPPELWLLPYFLPIHPGRMWCHCRMVYLPMSYLYGKRFVGPINQTILSLRKELYIQAYHQIDWDLARNQCAKEDLYYPHPLLQDILWKCLQEFAEPLLVKWPFSKLRQRALSTVMKHIRYEDVNTNYLCIGPINKVLNMLCCWVDDPNSTAVKSHFARVKDYLWVAEDGMKMQFYDVSLDNQGYNGSQLWDAVLSVQAIIETNLRQEYGLMLTKAHEFIKMSQVRMRKAEILVTNHILM
ncbi:cycloartenol synthase [Striga asiatica]|uniref:Terpene cyclase/mutase family member n=1 Tax=Striga asiatica TaxID=4170 RepID=A0A5A7QXW6_STRAF|nr:cycloartenol synthase [Striga asiatica]